MQDGYLGNRQQQTTSYFLIQNIIVLKNIQTMSLSEQHIETMVDHGKGTGRYHCWQYIKKRQESLLLI